MRSMVEGAILLAQHRGANPHHPPAARRGPPPPARGGRYTLPPHSISPATHITLLLHHLPWLCLHEPPGQIEAMAGAQEGGDLFLLGVAVGRLGREGPDAAFAGKGVGVCGEMAGDPAFTDLLLAMGLRNFSMHPSRIPAIKQRILRADTRQLAPHLADLLRSDDPESACARFLKRRAAAVE